MPDKPSCKKLSIASSNSLLITTKRSENFLMWPLAISQSSEDTSIYHLAIESYQQHLNITREIQDREGVAKALGNLANAYYALENYQQAVTYQQQYLAIAQEILDQSSIQQAYSNLGIADHGRVNLPLAKECYQEQLAISKRIED